MCFMFLADLKSGCVLVLRHFPFVVDLLCLVFLGVLGPLLLGHLPPHSADDLSDLDELQLRILVLYLYEQNRKLFD